MGSPRRPRKKYETPEHPWRKERIDAEKILVDEYGLKNKKEVYKISSELRSYFRQARSLISSTSLQGKKEEKQLLDKLYNYNLVQDKNMKVENVLNLNIKDLMERRLQTVIYKHGMAKTINQSRQFIIHGHIFVGGKKVTVPSYLVRRDEENQITFDPVSGLSSPDNPERVKIQEMIHKRNPMVEIKKEEKKEHTAESKEIHTKKEEKSESKKEKPKERKIAKAKKENTEVKK
jgi:small subunit ribosomal protein S4